MANFLQRAFRGTQARELEKRSTPTWSIGDPAFGGFIQQSIASLTEVSETLALRQPAIWRCVSLIAGTIATLPLRTWRLDDNGDRVQVGSFLDNPAPMGLTKFNWLEMIVAHLLLQGEVGMVHVLNGAGNLAQLLPVHAANYTVKWTGTQKEFKLTQGGKVDDYSQENFTQLLGMTLNGLRGISPIQMFRRNIQLADSESTAALKQMTKGFLVAALISPEAEDLTEDEGRAIMKGLDERTAGAENAGALRMVNRRMKVQELQHNNVDAQFLQQREFSVTEAARIFGIPPHLLAQLEKTTSFGTGLAENNAALAKFCLMHWTSRLEEAFSALLPSPRFCEFDYKGLLQGTPGDEINLIIAQVEAGLMSQEEARTLLHLGAVEPGNTFVPLGTPPPVPIVDKKDAAQGGSKAFSRGGYTPEAPMTLEAHFHMDPGAVQVDHHSHIDAGAVNVSTPVTIAKGAVQATLPAPAAGPTRRITKLSRGANGTVSAITEES